jgi:hypothetical protein
MNLLVIDYTRYAPETEAARERREAEEWELKVRAYAVEQGWTILDCEHVTGAIAIDHPAEDIVPMGVAAAAVGMTDGSPISRAIREGFLERVRNPETGRLGVSVDAVKTWRAGQRVIAPRPLSMRTVTDKGQD